jgi:hypothetical protein
MKCPSYAKKIGVRQAIKMLKNDFGVRRISWGYKHAQEYFIVPHARIRSFWKKGYVGRGWGNGEIHLCIVGIPSKPHEPKMAACDKCAEKGVAEKLHTIRVNNIDRMLCPDCLVKWKQATDKYFEHWLQGQYGTFVFKTPRQVLTINQI